MGYKTAYGLSWGVGDKVRARRHELGMSQVEVAYASLISTTYVTRIEGGHHTPSLATLYMLADALKCEPWDLLPPKSEVAL